MSYRILHVIPGLGHGGAEHQLLMNIQRLDPLEFESHVCHLYPRTILAPALEEAGATVHSAVASGPFAGPIRVWKLRRLVKKIKPDLIHTSNVLAEYYGGVAGRLSGVPVVGTLTNTSDKEVQLVDNPHLNGFKLGTVTQLRRLIRKTHKRHIAISEHVADSAVKELNLKRANIDVIHRGIDSEELIGSAGDVDALRNSLELGSSSPVILNVGRLVSQKGQRYLIEAMPSIVEAQPNALLLIAGVGYLEEQLRKVVEDLNMDDHVRFLGRRDDVPTLMQLADMFVFSSLFEGFGVSLLEASASAMPVVASNVGPIPEIVLDNETGLLVPPADPEAIAEAVIRLASDDELRGRIALAAKRRSDETFSIERSASLLADFYVKTLTQLGKAK